MPPERVIEPRVADIAGTEGYTVASPSRRRVGAAARATRVWFRAFLLVAWLVMLALATPVPPAHAAGPDAVLTPSGYNANLVARGDDTSNLVVNLPFTMNWNGTDYTQIYINMNGNCSFGSGFTGYNPNTNTLAGTNANIMAPFWADVDTRNTASSQVSYSSTSPGTVPTVGGRPAFFVNWIDVAAYNLQAAPTNSFQLVIVDRSDTGAGNFDFMYNYDRVTWDIATAASSLRARVGWGRAGTGYELPGSGTARASASALSDTAATGTSLIQNELNDQDQLGRYVWQVRAGAAPNVPPVVTVTNRILEGNVPGVYSGYDGAGDATATDADGSVTSFTSNLPLFLPLGVTSVLWTAIDDRSSVSTRTQSVTVTDTTPPVLPTLTSPSHTPGVWTGSNSVTVNSTVSTDTCAGVLGASYSWSQNAPVSPDAGLDASTASTFTVSVPSTATIIVEDEAFPRTVWPTGPGAWARTSTYMRIATTAGRYHAAAHSAEIYDDSNNSARHTESFSKTFNLSGYDVATLSFWDYHSAFSSTADFTRVEYSTNGTTWTTLQTSTVGAAGWTQRVYALPNVANVTVRFTGSVSAIDEYANWDDILIVGQAASTTNLSNTARSVNATTTLADGTWYFNLRTADAAGNWTATRSFGPVLIDSGPPVTTSNTPSGWSTSTVSVSLTATDTGSGVASTRYKLDAASVATYTAAIPISTDGTHTLRYWSVDVRGNVEATKTATVRVDKTPPTVPGAFSASAVSTSSVTATWTASTDAISGVSAYGVYRDGSLVATTTALTYTMTGLTPGQTYLFAAAALDVAGNWSARTASISETLPLSQIWMEISPTSIDFGTLDPGTNSVITSGTVVTVGGVGMLNYDLTCSAEDFTSLTTPTATPTMPAGYLTYAVTGWANLPDTAFTNSAAIVSASVGSAFPWNHRFVFDYSLNMPWTYEPGVYTTNVRYTAVAR